MVCAAVCVCVCVCVCGWVAATVRAAREHGSLETAAGAAAPGNLSINLKMKLKQARASGLNVQVGGAGSDVAQSGRARTAHSPC